ncbi:YeeE/YedE thiosulfate transporter family protein [uncultured Cohaesibacter sp.]|uniref:YeeE/YedE family protein n=1 Tax=uncultured Cohaesibacter sp. TaxID=1002546 RepID=UPI0029315BB0|nr:YeeE/YedE family protein [uncultured Cohaesibacter sp.]
MKVRTQEVQAFSYPFGVETLTEFTPLTSYAGGMLIGLSAVLLMLFWGRIAGMTGILAGIIPPLGSDLRWKASFLAGAILAPLLFQLTIRDIDYQIPISTEALIIGGIITGIGVTFGSGCTSGHGICGLARFSRRSAVAVTCFMSFAFLTVFIIRHIL